MASVHTVMMSKGLGRALRDFCSTSALVWVVLIVATSEYCQSGCFVFLFVIYFASAFSNFFKQ